MQLPLSKPHAAKTWVFCPPILIYHAWSQKMKEETNKAKAAKTLNSHPVIYPVEVGMQSPL